MDLQFQLGDKTFKEQFYVTGLGKQKIILGFPWLHKHNLIIDWKKGEITWKSPKIDWKKLLKKEWKNKQIQQPKIEEILDEEERKNHTTVPMEEDRNEILIKLLEKHLDSQDQHRHRSCHRNQADQTDEEIVPKEYHKYLDVFNEEKAHRFPSSRPWDHEIKLNEGFEPKSFKNYNLTGSHWQNKSNWTNSLKKIWRKVISDLLNC